MIRLGRPVFAAQVIIRSHLSLDAERVKYFHNPPDKKFVAIIEAALPNFAH
jgi:hypothetical protein